MELASQLFLAFDEGYLDENALEKLLGERQRECAGIAALNRSLAVKGSKVRIADSHPAALTFRYLSFRPSLRPFRSQPFASGLSTLDLSPPAFDLRLSTFDLS